MKELELKELSVAIGNDTCPSQRRHEYLLTILASSKPFSKMISYHPTDAVRFVYQSEIIESQDVEEAKTWPVRHVVDQHSWLSPRRQDARGRPPASGSGS